MNANDARLLQWQVTFVPEYDSFVHVGSLYARKMLQVVSGHPRPVTRLHRWHYRRRQLSLELVKTGRKFEALELNKVRS
jgi:hypothetical protein